MMHRLKKNIFSRLFPKRGVEIDPDEVLLDAHNLPKFDVDRLEGTMVRPIDRASFLILSLAVLAFGIIVFSKLINLQVVNGADFALRSENNILQTSVVFANRGIIKDRTDALIVWNEPGENEYAMRRYADSQGISNIVGFVGYPRKDSKGIYYDTAITGRAGAEEFFDAVLSGKNGLKISEMNALGQVQSESVLEPPKDGAAVVLSIDMGVQEALFQNIKRIADERGFTGGAGVIMDVHSGEVLALATYPEYSAAVMSDGLEQEKISDMITSHHKPFLNRAVSGLYIPGSIIKPFVALGALEEKLVDPRKEFYSSGRFVVPNPYNPSQPTIFADWRAHGYVDMRRALAVSSNVYFYTIGGGQNDQPGLGISNIEKYMKAFGFGAKTGIEMEGEAVGVVPSPEWKEATFGESVWRLGDTYNSSIGQYGFQVTPLQSARAIGVLANGGSLVRPTILTQDGRNKAVWDEDRRKGKSADRRAEEIDIEEANRQVVLEGMREAVLSGTAAGLNMPSVKVAGKTGTAELGSIKQSVNSWVVGFFPYDNPRFSFAVLLENGSATNLVGSSAAFRGVLEWMTIHTPHYLE